MDSPQIVLAKYDNKMRILADADMLLELFINRTGCVEDVERLFMEVGNSNNIEIYITDLSLEKIRFYLSKPDAKLASDAIDRSIHSSARRNSADG